jgi:phage-related protein
MTDRIELVKDAQDLEVISPLIELYELTIGSGTNNKLYFHSAKDLDNGTATNDLIFGKGTPGGEQTYVTLPIFMEDIEKSTSGAMNRPKLSIANVESILKQGSDFKTQMEDGTWDGTIDGELIIAQNFRMDHLVGQRITRRRTLEKYTGANVDAYEFDTETFIIDRISSKNPVFCELELASPADLGGIRIPARQVIGKYCPWAYQGHADNANKSACKWGTSSQISAWNGDTPASGAARESLEYSFYFTQDDEPLVYFQHFLGSANSMWKGAYYNTAYNAGQYVSHGAAYTATTPANAAIANSTNLTLVAAASNVNIKIGFSVAGTGVASGTTVVQIAGTYVKLSAAIAARSSQLTGLTLTFTSPSEYYRAQAHHPVGGTPPAARIPQWTLARTYSNYNSSTAYILDPSDSLKNPYVKHLGTIWRAVAPSTGVTPGDDEGVWIRGDACGKLLTSCKIRYQAVPQIYGAAYDDDAVPAYEVNTAMTLPFGGFPGSNKFR